MGIPILFFMQLPLIHPLSSSLSVKDPSDLLKLGPLPQEDQKPKQRQHKEDTP